MRIKNLIVLVTSLILSPSDFFLEVWDGLFTNMKYNKVEV